jgi:hypothetical protein
MAAPLEIIAGPLTLWYGPVGETVPDTNVTPAGSWVKIGVSGAGNYMEDGVIVGRSQDIEAWRPLGESGPVKLYRTAEDLIIRVTLADLRLEMLSIAFAANTVATAAGPPAIKTLGLYCGPGELNRIALLVRGASPYVAGKNRQYQIPVCAYVGSFEMAFQKSPPAGLLMEFQGIVDPNASSNDEKMGTLIAQTA